MKRLLSGVTAGAVLALLPLSSPATAAPDDTANISHVEIQTGGKIGVLVSVPEGADVDLDKVTLEVEGKAARSSAAAAGTAEDEGQKVLRTSVLAIDTSDSMRGARFDAARSAALVYLDAVPEDVEVGIVTFDREVETLLALTTDRAAARGVIESLELARGTRVYDGVLAAVEELGADGQRSILVLSDGENTNDTPIESVVAKVAESGVQLDAVALDQSVDTAPLQALVTAGNGQLIPSDPATLTETFAAEAASLARQILVTATIPEGVNGTEADLKITLPTGGQTLTASSYSVIRTKAVETGPIKDTTGSDLLLPKNVMYGGLAAIGLSLLVLLGALFSIATASKRPSTMEQRIAAYGAAPSSSHKSDSSSFNMAEMKDAAASVLQRNRGLEARIEKRLEAAGSSLKPSEWLLLHGLIAILSAMAGLLVGGGSIGFLLLGALIGGLVPWLWLGFKRKRRIAAFNAGLADTLQLIAGSLSAGMSLAQAMDSVVNEGQEPIAGEFKRVLVETRLGVPLEAALDGIAQRIGSLDFGWVVMAIRIQREVGGNLAELLTTVAATLRERDYLRRQVKTLSAEGRLSAYILIALPIGVFIYLILLRREYVAPLFTDVIGILLLLIAVVLLSIGWFLMSRIVKVEV